MDGVTVSVLGALVALAVAIVLILKKVQPTYAMIFGAVIGGLVGGAGLTGTVSFIISGTQGIVSAIIRIVTAGILAGALIESGAAERIAESIINKMGAKRSLIAITLATWLLTTVGVFGDVACITVAPIALQMARRAGYHKMGVLMAQLGAVRAGNVMSPNPNAIAAAEAFNLPLTSIIAVGVIPAVTALLNTTEGDERVGVQLVAKALEAPIRQIAANAGIDGSVVLEKIKTSGKVGYGFDAYKEVYCDMISAGIVDPAKVTRSALENAASVSSMVLTTEALVADKPEPPAPAAPGAGMGDMGGMY